MRASPLKAMPQKTPDESCVDAHPKHRVRSGLTVILREPFFQFLVLGTLIWLGVELWQAHHDRYIIRIGPADRQRIAADYYRQFGQVPTTDQLRQLLDRYVREEIYLREGQALNLDQDDEIVRRRIVQKYEFLQTDLAVSDTPTPVELQRWFEQNEVRYLTPERVAFSHVYFSVDHDGEAAARKRAADTLEKLRAMHVSRAADEGDSFPGPSDVSSLAPDEASRLFGESQLTQALFQLPVDQWSGPYRSGYGWHLVYIAAKRPPAVPLFEAIKERVLTDYQDEQRQKTNSRAFEKLRANYTVREAGEGDSMVLSPDRASAEPPMD